jgi:hypothetical protein
MPTPSPGTIDITALVDKMKRSWVAWALALVSAQVAAIPGIGPVMLGIYNYVGKRFVEWALTKIADSGEMLAFFTNTAIRKASQAKDYTDAVHFKESLPESATKEQFANAEKNEIIAFRNFVVVTN